MLSAWWLCLIIPVSACFGYGICCLMLMAKMVDEADKND